MSGFVAVIVTSSTGSAMVRVREHHVLDNCENLHDLLGDRFHHITVLSGERRADEWWCEYGEQE